MELKINENKKAQVVLNKEEMDTISILDWEEQEYLPDIISASIGVVIAIVLHYSKGVLVHDHTEEKTYIRWVDMWCDTVDAMCTPWPSMPAEYVGALFELAYTYEDRRDEIKEKLDQFVDLCEKANQIGVAGWNYPTHKKVDKIWNSFIKCDYKHRRIEDLADELVDYERKYVKDVFNIDVVDDELVQDYFDLIPATFEQENMHPVVRSIDRLTELDTIFREIYDHSPYAIKLKYDGLYYTVEMVEEVQEE